VAAVRLALEERLAHLRTAGIVDAHEEDASHGRKYEALTAIN
jgi:hypothetical protein